MSSARPLEPAPDSPQVRPQKVSWAWVGYLIFGLFLLCLIALDIVEAYGQHWVGVAGITAFTVLYLIVPTGAAKWLRRYLMEGRNGSSR